MANIYKIIVTLFILYITTSISYSSDVTPTNVRILLTGYDGEMRINWDSKDFPNSPAILYSKKYFSPYDSVDYDAVVCSSDSLATNKEWNGYVNTGLLSSLESITTYFYTVGDKVTQTWSPIFNFTTGVYPSRHENVTSYSILCYGDMGDAGGSIETINNIIGRLDDFSMVLHVGDIAYADNNKKIGSQMTWSTFLNSVEPISSHIPYMVCPGNHDYFAKGNVYRQTFNMPGGKHPYYSYDYNGIHYISFSTEDEYYKESKQYKFIEKDLKHFRQENPTGWIVAWAHRPFYCSSTKNWCSPDDNNRKFFLESVEHLLLKYNVDIFISGHTHSYERSYPVYKNEIRGTFENPKATVHFVIGTGGNVGGMVSGWHPKPIWSAGKRLEVTGYGLINFSNQTHLQWQFVRDSTNQVEDEVWVQKGFFN